ncbi:hypothetical protein RSP822_23455 [Ralstonia solanacearum]|nr:hypothetical protein RSP822_23455 [Ralstonia solanacearum]
MRGSGRRSLQDSRADQESGGGAPIHHPTGPARRRRGSPPAGAAIAMPAGPGAQFVSRHSQVAATERVFEPDGFGLPN